MPPAARIGDIDTCANHGTVPITTGFPTVLIGFSPAARMSDIAACTDVIIKGSPTVIIGNMMAARIGDNTMHGGIITTGYPTVIIGESGSGGAGGASGVGVTPPPPPPAGGGGGGAGKGQMVIIPGDVSSAPVGAAEPTPDALFKPSPLEKDKDTKFIDGKAGVTNSPSSKSISYDSSREEKVKKEKEGEKMEASIEASHVWDKADGAWMRSGDDKTRVDVGGYGYEIASGVSYKPKDGEFAADLIKAKGHAEAFSSHLERDLIGKAVKGEVDSKILAAEAEASVGAEWSKNAKDIHARVGGSIDLAKIAGALTWTIPLWGGHALSLGLGGEAQVGASAEAQAGGGWTKERGYYFGAKAKAGCGVGGGLSFSIGFK